jgi:DNA protecting protein DprA
MTADERAVLAAAYLSRVAEPANLQLWMLVREVGYEVAAAAVRAGEVSEEVSVATEARRASAHPEDDLEAAERNGIRLVMPASAEWPHFGFAALAAAGEHRIRQLRAGHRLRPDRGELIPPLALWVRGTADLSSLGVSSLAVVGSRAATAYGEHVASDFSYGLGQRRVAVVSGGAYGIDAAAHRGVLAAEGTSVLVSAGGLDRPYPSGNQRLYEQTAQSGLLISERPPGSAPHRQRFLSRKLRNDRIPAQSRPRFLDGPKLLGFDTVPYTRITVGNLPGRIGDRRRYCGCVPGCVPECDACDTDTVDEWFMVHDEVWAAAGLGEHEAVLCVGCLETRLGRELRPRDFAALPINAPVATDSDRLLDRMGYVKVIRPE